MKREALFYLFSVFSPGGEAEARPLSAKQEMIRIKEIQEALLHLVGWDLSGDAAGTADKGLAESESGLYFQGAHPLLTLGNLRSVMPADSAALPEWDAAKAYSAGDMTRHGDGEWKATRDNQGQEPSADSSFWKPFDALSGYLEHLTRGGIATVVQTFAQDKKLEGETRELLERRAFSDVAGRLKDTILSTGKIVGLEIVPARAMGVTVKIERVGLQMSGAAGNVRLYLFHSSRPGPVRTFDLDFASRSGGFQWFAVADCFLPYAGEGNSPGGAWYLCYNQDDLPAGMEAVNMGRDWSREPCGSCNPGSAETWRELTKYMQVSPFACHAPEGFAADPRLWDVAGNMYTNTRSYGLNCEVTVGCDLTDFVISQRQAFATALQRQVAATALRAVAVNPEARVNRNQANASRADILYELDGNTLSPRPGGLGAELAKAYKALSIDTRGMDRICLSCNNRGVRYRTV